MIRDAIPSDFEGIESLCREFWKETQFADDVPYKNGSALRYIDIAFGCNMLFVFERDNEIVGFSAGCIAPLMGDGDVLSGTELAWWVSPQYRGGSGGLGLLKALEHRAKDLGCKYWNMVAMKSSMYDGVSALYKKMGYQLEESTWTKVF